MWSSHLTEFKKKLPMSKLQLYRYSKTLWHMPQNWRVVHFLVAREIGRFWKMHCCFARRAMAADSLTSCVTRQSAATLLATCSRRLICSYSGSPGCMGNDFNYTCVLSVRRMLIHGCVSSFKLSTFNPGGGGTRVHRSRVGSAGLRDLKILHVLQRLKKGGQNSTKIPQC